MSKERMTGTYMEAEMNPLGMLNGSIQENADQYTSGAQTGGQAQAGQGSQSAQMGQNQAGQGSQGAQMGQNQAGQGSQGAQMGQNQAGQGSQGAQMGQNQAGQGSQSAQIGQNQAGQTTQADMLAQGYSEFAVATSGATNEIAGYNEDIEFNPAMADADDLEALQRAQAAEERQSSS
ncbi:YfhD family protein [Brevibacillus dissolubilis]|uniref:YfhD family protein n=1 Tax=Brevibacillus dissolubilis TaxID=1844116 RepID=UPI0020FFFDCD|nr:YfhD family protein [Brevibacillus dissolubilis]